jgi:Protein of unknown function (DUF1573)
MNRSVLAVAAVAAALLLPLAGAADEKAGAKGPRISIEPESFDFGRTAQNKTLEKEFTIRNFGSEDLVIENVSTTCGCTVASGYAKTIKPGAKTPLLVRLETRAYTGHLTRSVMVRSNDSATSLLELKVEATVVPATASSK